MRRIRKSVKYPVEITPTTWEKLVVGINGMMRWAVDGLNFSRPTEIWMAKCKEHKVYFLDYKHGFDPYLSCPKCVMEYEQEV